MNSSFSLSTKPSFYALALILAIAFSASLTGCANPDASASAYTYEQAQHEQSVRLGTITAVRPITIKKEQTSGGGLLAGGALGGVAGNAIGGGKGQAITTVGGALLGALAGNVIENQVGKTKGVEITVRLDSGETRVVAQAADIAMGIGQRVQVISGRGPTRVVPVNF